jgi:glycosyltransferase involved in cell wall biosynthesis
MKVALIHDVYLENGGAERVFDVFVSMFPKADIFIPLINKKNKVRLERKSRGKISTSFFNSIPLIHSASLFLKPLLYYYWEFLDLSNYDLVISSSHSFSSKSVITSAESLHVSYVHTSPRYLYTEFNETRILKKKFFKILFAPLLNWLRIQDYLGAQRPDFLIANSEVVKRRLMKYYRRDSQVIYPPIEIPKKKKKQVIIKKKYFLCLSRLATQKGIDLAIRACNEKRLPLVIVGTGSQEKYLKSIAGPTITFLGYVSDDQLDFIYAQAKAFIYCSINEDFGMAPVEALAHGVPVVAYRSGGVTETISVETGVLFDEYTPEALNKALQNLMKKKISPQACIERAKRFSTTQFKKKLLDYLEKHSYPGNV